MLPRFIVLTVLCLSSTAVAQQPAPISQPGPPPDTQHSFAITVSPIHLIFPVVEVAAEFRLARNMSIAGIGGVGSIELDNTSTRVTVYELGGQFRYYAVGRFDHGMQIGAELLYLGGRADEGSVSAIASGLAIGPFIGYKFSAGVGFTVDVQGGVEFVAISAESSTGASEEAGRAIPLVNINLGWAF